MNLEVLERSATSGSSKPPIVLVHGAWHGAWCWEGNFLDYFPARGWNTYALSLRGHGRSEGGPGLRWSSISDYVADLKQVVSSLESPPILIGHSMGGLVVQKFLEDERAAGAVLLASVPPSGTLKFNIRIMRRHPLIWLGAILLMRLYPIVNKPEYAKEWLFSPSFSDADLAAHVDKLQSESYRAALDMLAFNLPNPSKVQAPVAVLGGEIDQIFSVQEIHSTAKAYGVDAKVFPDIAHNMMAESGWESVSDWILSWALSIADARG